MINIGARFREAREAKGLSIAEVAASTRILQRYLQALEDEQLDLLPGDVYARGFVRNYAQYLGLPPDEMVQLYRQQRGAPTDRIQVVPAAVPPRTRSCLLPSAFGTFFAILVLLGVLFWTANLAGLTRLPTQIAAGPTATTTPPPPTDFPTTPPQPSGTPPSRLPPTATPEGGAPSAAPTPTFDAPLVVEVRIAPDAPRGSWLQIATESNPNEFTGIMTANTNRIVKAQQQVFVHAGDASVVEVIVNGISQGRMGAIPGGVAKKTYTPTSPTAGGNAP